MQSQEREERLQMTCFAQLNMECELTLARKDKAMHINGRFCNGVWMDGTLMT